MLPFAMSICQEGYMTASNAENKTLSFQPYSKHLYYGSRHKGEHCARGGRKNLRTCLSYCSSAMKN